MIVEIRELPMSSRPILVLIIGLATVVNLESKRISRQSVGIIAAQNRRHPDVFAAYGADWNTPVHKLQSIEIKKIDNLYLPRASNISNDRFIPFNPSIIKTENGYLATCRTYYRKGMPPYKDRNFLLTYDRAMNLLRQEEIVTPALQTPYLSKTYQACKIVGCFSGMALCG
jgi:hypothetical protein